MSGLVKEIDNAKGIFKGRYKKELQEKINQLTRQIENLKHFLSTTVHEYGYKTVKEFLTEYSIAKAEHNDYTKAIDDWEKKYGKAKADSIDARLEQFERQEREQKNNKQSTHYYSRDRGAR